MNMGMIGNTILYIRALKRSSRNGEGQGGDVDALRQRLLDVVATAAPAARELSILASADRSCVETAVRLAAHLSGGGDDRRPPLVARVRVEPRLSVRKSWNQDHLAAPATLGGLSAASWVADLPAGTGADVVWGDSESDLARAWWGVEQHRKKDVTQTLDVLQQYAFSHLQPRVHEQQSSGCLTLLLTQKCVYKSLSGVLHVARGAVLDCALRVSSQRSRRPVCQLVPRFLRDRMAAVAAPPQPTVTVVLGGADIGLLRGRLRVGLALGAQASSGLVVFTGTADDYSSVLEIVCDLGYTLEDLSKFFLVDLWGIALNDFPAFAAQRIEDCTADVAPGTCIEVRLVTCDWQMPRSLLLFMRRLLPAPPRDEHLIALESPSAAVSGVRYLLSHKSVSALLSDYDSVNLKHYMEGSYLAHAVLESPHAMVNTMFKHCADDMRSIRFRMRALAITFPPQGDRHSNLLRQLHSLLNEGDEAFLPLVQLISESILRHTTAIHLTPSGDDGNQALHIAAQRNALRVARVLVLCFGSSPHDINRLGHKPVYYSKRLGFTHMTQLLQDFEGPQVLDWTNSSLVTMSSFSST